MHKSLLRLARSEVGACSHFVRAKTQHRVNTSPLTTRMYERSVVPSIPRACPEEPLFSTRGFIPLIPLAIAALIVIAGAGYFAVKNDSGRATELGSGNENNRDVVIEFSNPQINAQKETSKRSMNLMDIERQISLAQKSGGMESGSHAWLLEQISILGKQGINPQKIAELRATLSKIPVGADSAPSANPAPQESSTRREVPSQNAPSSVPRTSAPNRPENRPQLEILTAKEKATLPDCTAAPLTVSPLPVNSIVGIEPIGSSNPPEHTHASISSDPYIFVPTRESSQTVTLVAPADIWLMFVAFKPNATMDPEDYVIKYAVCKDVYGVVDHLKKLSPEVQKIVDARSCSYTGNAATFKEGCPMLMLEPVKAGTPLGEVGGRQGNLNFGIWDLRKTNYFISPWRHGFLSLHSVCPFDYYPSPLKETLKAKLDGGSCGSVSKDVAGTLAGDWYIGDAVAMRPADWGKFLYFGPSNVFPDQSVISVSGIFVSQPTKWIFTALSSGTVNRKFSDVTADSNIYCYDNDGTHRHRDGEKGIVSGRMLVQLTSSTTLKIEHQSGLCRDGNMQFTNPTAYER